jgi:hypothetical protein
MSSLLNYTKNGLSSLKTVFSFACNNAVDAFCEFNSEIADDYKSCLPEDKAEALFLTATYPVLAPIFTAYAFCSGFADGIGHVTLSSEEQQHTNIITNLKR